MKKYYILLFIFQMSMLVQSYSQEWIKTFDIQNNTISKKIIETYDGGFIIAADIAVGNSWKIGWIIKTTINGDIRWEKQFGNGSNMWMILGLDTTQDGGVIITGLTDTIDTHSNPFIIKLSSCGDIDFCKIYASFNEYDVGRQIISLADGTYLLEIHSSGTTLEFPYVKLNHIDSNGEIIWEKIFFQQNSLGYPFDEFSLSLTSNGQYLISGTCYHVILGQTSPLWLWPMLLLVDSTGELNWELPWGASLPFSLQINGDGYQSTYINNTIFTSMSDYHWPGSNFYSPCLIKTTNGGSEISYKDIVDNTVYGKATTISKLSDSVLFIGAGYQKPIGQNNLSVIKTDTSGNVLKEKILSNSEYVPIDATFTKDNKYLIIADDFVNYWIFHLWKLNKNLEYDSIYTKPRVYDSLCPHPITSSTIYSTCDLATSVREPAFNTERVKMHLFPNPASTVLHVEMPECIQKNSKTEHLNVTTILHKWNKELQLRVFDFMGRQEFYKSVKPQEKEVILDVSSWQSGMYFFQLLYGDTVVAEAKGIVN